MRLLCFDCALTRCHAAAVEDGRVQAEAALPDAGAPAERLLPLLAQVLALAGWSWADVDGFAVTVGPGSFTGVRAGIAAARGLALAAGRPAVGVGTLEATAAGIAGTDGAPLVAAHDARRGDLYLQVFDADGRPGGEPVLLSAADAVPALPAGRLRLAGTGADLLARRLEAAGRAVRVVGPAVPAPAAWAALAARRLAEGALPPAPLYLRAPDARLPEPRR